MLTIDWLMPSKLCPDYSVRSRTVRVCRGELVSERTFVMLMSPYVLLLGQEQRRSSALAPFLPPELPTAPPTSARPPPLFEQSDSGKGDQPREQ